MNVLSRPSTAPFDCHHTSAACTLSDYPDTTDTLLDPIHMLGTHNSYRVDYTLEYIRVDSYMFV